MLLSAVNFHVLQKLNVVGSKDLSDDGMMKSVSQKQQMQPIIGKSPARMLILQTCMIEFMRYLSMTGMLSKWTSQFYLTTKDCLFHTMIILGGMANALTSNSADHN